MKKNIIIAICTVAAFFIGAYVTGHLLVVHGGEDSVKHTVFWKSAIWKDTSEKPLKKGDYILFEFAPDVYYAKRIACMPGQSLQKLEGMWFCGSRKIHDAVEVTHSPSSGKQLQQFEYYGIIPDGKYFVVGDYQNSFDSRYWGFVDADKVLFTLIPVW